MQFKEYIEKTTSQLLIQELGNLKSASEKALKFILDCLKNLVLEGSSSTVKLYGDYVVRSRVFSEYMNEKYQSKSISGRFGEYKHSCGEDGCAYFFTNKIVVKFSNDHKEMNIAESVAGLLKRVPIMGALEIEIEAEELIIYAIIMRELDTSINLRSGYILAFQIFTSVLDKLMDIVKARPDVSVEYIRKRLSLAYMTRNENVNQETIEFLEDLIRAVRAVYIRSGYLLGADWGSRNLGSTSKGRVQPFDFGRSYVHEPARSQAVKIERKTLLIPANHK